ncbi:helix-turn-helix domain-containing protein [Pontiella sp.]|uniref:helix-turn-helix domain-containing protein n=1 Tax=Pontiella sp. TaxID=2837462 RepID=UPI00356B52FD
MNALQPTLWRTCRVLAHPVRIDILRELLKEPRSVTLLADTLNIAVSVASTYLRALSASGLIQNVQQGRFVVYSATPNPHVEHSPEIFEALRTVIENGIGNAAIIQEATAFTHPRRIEIVRALQGAPRDPTALSTATGIPLLSLGRHIGKLVKREIIGQTDSCCHLLEPKNVLTATLMAIALGQVTPA